MGPERRVEKSRGSETRGRVVVTVYFTGTIEDVLILGVVLTILHPRKDVRTKTSTHRNGTGRVVKGKMERKVTEGRGSFGPKWCTSGV